MIITNMSTAHSKIIGACLVPGNVIQDRRASGRFEWGIHRPAVPDMNDLNPRNKPSLSIRQNKVLLIAGRA